jgi:hypothetical protein
VKLRAPILYSAGSPGSVKADVSEPVWNSLTLFMVLVPFRYSGLSFQRTETWIENNKWGVVIRSGMRSFV